MFTTYLFLKKEKNLPLNFGYFYFFTRSSTFLTACRLLIFMLSQFIAELIDLDCDFKVVQGVKGLLTNNFCHT